MSVKNKVVENKQVWDAIAESFDETRRKPWEQCIQFINKLPEESVVADIGCGNGRHLIHCANRCFNVIGVDISLNLLKITREKTRGKRNVELVHADALFLPFKNNCIDHLLFIATLHNIRGRKNRINALLEVKRVLKTNGTALISVWSRWQDRFIGYFLKKIVLPKQGEEFGDITIMWRKNDLKVPRFYHLYSKHEFVADIKKAGFLIQKVDSVKIASKKLKDNYFALVEKIN